MSGSIRVLIVGGGLGGLCLAQGLRQAGINVAVYERDVAPVFRQQGYRIHIDTRGATALRACLPTHLFALFAATASRPGTQITVVNQKLRKLRVIKPPTTPNNDPDQFSAGVDRLTLREILLSGLEDVLHFNREFSHFERLATGGIRVCFVDGTEVSADVLVAADGVNSRVRQQFLPTAGVLDTKVRCIYGKTLLTATTRPLIPEFFRAGFNVVVGSLFQRYSLALGMVEFLQPPAEAAAQIAPEVHFHSAGDYLMWSFNAGQEQFALSDQELLHMDGSSLQLLVLKKIKHWHSALRMLIAAGDPAEIFPIAVRVSIPCEPWPSTPITLLGDAIHAMSPAGGSGANMALLDAHRLCQALVSATRGEKPLLEAIHNYEARMLKDGFEAVRFSASGGILKTGQLPKR